MIQLVAKVKNVVENLKIPITFFEFGTAMAFLHFAEQETDVNIIEVGMGGRLDATNLCKSDITIITSIAKDHTSYLGRFRHFLDSCWVMRNIKSEVKTQLDSRGF